MKGIMEEYGTVKNIKTKEVQKRQKTGNGLFYKGKRGNKAISKKGHDGWDAELYRNACRNSKEFQAHLKANKSSTEAQRGRQKIFRKQIRKK